ncbi:hypothetical protein, partial [Sinorhizobium sp. 6-117]
MITHQKPQRSQSFLSPASDALHVDDAAVALANCDLEACVAAPSAIDEEPATAVDPTNIMEAAIAEQSFPLSAGYSSTSIEAAADPDVDVDVGLS